MANAAGKVYPVHNNKFKFGTKGLTSETGDMVMPADLENFSPTIVLSSYFKLLQAE